MLYLLILCFARHCRLAKRGRGDRGSERCERQMKEFPGRPASEGRIVSKSEVSIWKQMCQIFLTLRGITGIDSQKSYSYLFPNQRLCSCRLCIWLCSSHPEESLEGIQHLESLMCFLGEIKRLQKVAVVCRKDHLCANAVGGYLHSSLPTDLSKISRRPNMQSQWQASYIQPRSRHG